MTKQKKTRAMRLNITKIMMILVLGFGLASTANAMGGGEDQMPIGTTEAPSASFLQSEKRSIAASNESSLVASRATLGSRSGNWWDDNFGMPGEEETEVSVVGGPVGDVTIPLLVTMLLIYLVYHQKQRKHEKKHKIAK